MAVCCLAALLEWAGLFGWLENGAAPLMRLLGMEPQAFRAVVLGAIRKDGVAIGLLDMSGKQVVIPFVNSWQLLSVVYLAGAGTPCMVTVLTLLREFSVRRTMGIVALQALIVILLSASLAWVSGV